MKKQDEVLNKEVIEWSDLGPTAIDNLIPFNKKNIPKNDFEININGNKSFILNSLHNIFPVHWFHGAREYIEKPYENHKNIIRAFQPLIILVYTVYSLCDSINDITKTPIFYFLKMACNNNNIDIEKYYKKTLSLYIYNNFDFYNKYREPYFEECTFIERYYFDELKKFNKTDNLKDADLAFIPITPASHIYERGINDFKDHYNKFINLINLDSNIHHFIVYPYTFYNQDYNNISFIDKRITILGLENEITNFNYFQDIFTTNPKEERFYNSITIPFHLKQNKHDVCKGIKDVVKPNINSKKNYLFCYVGMLSTFDTACIEYPDRKFRLINYRENILNEFVKEYGKDNVLIGRPDKNNAFDLYCQSKYALIFRGDCMTRVAFYQALMTGCIPIICNDCYLDYQNYNGYFFDLEKAIIRIPYCNELFNRNKFRFINENNIWNIIDKYISNDDLRIKKIEYIKNIVNYIDYNNFINNIRAPIYYSLKSIIDTNNKKKPYELVYINLKNSEILNFVSKEYNFKNAVIKNKELEIFDKIFDKIYKTYNIEKSNYILILVNYLSIESFKLINIDNTKKYILIFDIIEEEFLSYILKYPENTIILYTNLSTNNVIELDNIRLNYYGKNTEEMYFINDQLFEYGNKLNSKDCISIFENNKNNHIKNLVYYKLDNLVYPFNNINMNFTNSPNFTSYVFKNDYYTYINNKFKIYKFNHIYEIIIYLINNYL
tara:strand:- start:5837 stop:8002 length:2166 start_codon:yes stop_codon:yes gene_type:complete